MRRCNPVLSLVLSCLVAAAAVTAATVDVVAAPKRSPRPPTFAPNHLFVGGLDSATGGPAVFEFDESWAYVRTIPVALGNSTELNGLEFGPDGDLYVTVVAFDSPEESGVYRIDPALTVTKSFDTGTPGGLAFGPGGLVYVGDYQSPTGILRARDPDGGSTLSYDPSSGGFSFIDDVTIGPSGHVIVALNDRSGGSIHELDADLRFIRAFEPGGIADGVTGPALARDGSLLFADFSGDRIVRYGPDGALIGELPTTGLSLPWRPELGPDGRLYVGNYGGGDLSVLDADTGATLGTISHPDMSACVGVAFGPFRLSVKPKGSVLAEGTVLQKMSERGAVLSVSLGSGTSFLTFPSAGSAAGLGAAFPQARALVFSGRTLLGADTRTALVQGSTVSAHGIDGAEGAISFSVKGKTDAHGFFVPKSVSGAFQIGSAAAAASGSFKSAKRVN